MKTSTLLALALAAAGLAAAAVLLPGLNPVPTPTYAVPATSPVADHSAFDQLLRRHVNAQGLVDYEGFKTDEAAFNDYLALLSHHPPAASWPRADQLAYWLNAYNAYTIRLILNHYPVRSIKDIGPRLEIPFLTTPWSARFFSIGGTRMSLDGIEHGILRKKFKEPRIHFALVCASLSCPRLRNEAYAAARLDAQLNDQGRHFLNNPAKNEISPAAARLSKYFDWYASDWQQNGQSVRQWVNRYSTTKITADTKITYLPYNWSLNKQ